MFFFKKTVDTSQKVKYNIIKLKEITKTKSKKERSREMNELERTALNEILRTVTYIAEKLDEVDSKISLNDSQVLEHQEN